MVEFRIFDNNGQKNPHNGARSEVAIFSNGYFENYCIISKPYGSEISFKDNDIIIRSPLRTKVIMSKITHKKIGYGK